MSCLEFEEKQHASALPATYDDTFLLNEANKARNTNRKYVDPTPIKRKNGEEIEGNKSHLVQVRGTKLMPNKANPKRLNAIGSNDE